MNYEALIWATVSLTGAVTGITATYVSLRKQRTAEQSQIAQYQSAIWDAYQDVIEPLRVRVHELEESNAESRRQIREQWIKIQELQDAVKEKDKEIDRLYAGAELLHRQLRAIPEDPMWTP